jgi:CHASE2 domain-containing sensor protein
VLHSVFDKHIRARLLTVVFSVIAISVFCFEFFLQSVEPEPELPNPGLIHKLNSVAWFHSFSKAGHRPSEAHFVRLLTIVHDQEPDEILTPPGYCPQREFLSKLISALRQQAAAVIVIDKFFGDKCPQSAPETELLKKAIQTVSQEIPIIIGIHGETSQDLAEMQDGKLTPAQEAAFQKADLILTPHVNFGDSPNVAYGLMTLDADRGRIPISWRVFEPGNVPPVRSMKTVSVLAAEGYDTSSSAQDNFRTLENRGVHDYPYTDLISGRYIPTLSAVQVLCNGAYSPGADWRACTPGVYGHSLLRGHIVVIGEYTRSDLHTSPLGTVFGPILQVNYLESMLDMRYAWPANKPAVFFLGFLWFAVILAILELSSSWPRRLLYSGAAYAIFWVVICDVVFAEMGIYVIIGAPGLLVFVGKALDDVREKTKPQWLPSWAAAVASSKPPQDAGGNTKNQKK